MKTRRRLFLTLGCLPLAATLALSGCGAVQGALEAIQGDPTEKALITAAPEPLWTAEIQHASPQVAISQEANMAVTYFIKDDALMLGGFDLEDGSEKWAYPASTGGRFDTSPLDVRTIVDNGETFTLNLLDPIDEAPDESGYFERSHPFQVIKISSGEVVATTEARYWIGGTGTNCLDKDKACLVTKRGDNISTLSVSSTGEVSVNEAQAKFPEFAAVDRISVDGTFLGETKDGVPTIGFLADDKVVWTRPLSELGITDLTRSDSKTGYNDLVIGTNSYTKEGLDTSHVGDAEVVIVTSRLIDIAPLKNSTGVYTSYALDAKTGETLWDAEGTPCLEGAIMCSGESTIQEKNGGSDFLPSTQTVWRFDPMNGKKVWETEIEKMVLSDRYGWKTPEESSIQLVKVGKDYKSINITDGTLLDLTAEQVFTCEVQGPDFKAYKRSVPAEGLTTWTGNRSVVGCSTESDEIPVSGFSEAVVVTGSPRPFDVPEDWDVWDKQIRVVSTMEGLIAYKF